MNVVMDASAAVGLALAFPAAECFAVPVEQAALVIVPDLYVAEVCNVLWKYQQSGHLPMTRCEQAVEQLMQLPDRIEPGSHLYTEAFALACRHRHPVYDALYLVLARRNNAILLTLDRRLAVLAEQLEIEVILPPAPA